MALIEFLVSTGGHLGDPIRLVQYANLNISDYSGRTAYRMCLI